METLILSIVVGCGLAFTLTRILGYAKTLRYSVWLDLFFTLVLPLLFAGSYSGMVLAALSGITLSIILFFLKLLTPRSVYR